MIYGYCRVSTPKQSLKRQEDNIRALFPDAIIYSDVYSGKTNDRPLFQKLLKKVNNGDAIVFDEVSRMSRNAQEGFQDYLMLLSKGVSLKFLKEPQIDSEVYLFAQKEKQLSLTGDEIADPFIKAANEVILILIERQIKAAFEQAEKERLLLSRRTKEGMAKGRPAGRKKGIEQHQKKEKEAKKVIRKNNIAFGGSLNNSETIKLAGISAPTFYKYVKQMKKDALQRQMDITDFN